MISVSGTMRCSYDANSNMTGRTVSGTKHTLTYDAEKRLVGGERRRPVPASSTMATATGCCGWTGAGRGFTLGIIMKGKGRRSPNITTRPDSVLRCGPEVWYTELHGDHLGSATLATDASGNRVGELRYTPYGGVRWAWGIFPTDRLYTGQRWEASLGLYDYQARYYDPALGRFLQPDTLSAGAGNPQALNRYAYVYNNPLRYVDLTGHFSEEELLRYGVFYGPKQMAACQADEFGCAAWYWALRAAEEGDWLEAWGSINTWLRIGGSVEYRGRFGVGEGMLVLTLESGKQYQVFFGGLRDLDNPEVYLSVQNPLLEKPGDVRLQGVESLRRYVRQAEGGAHPMTEGDYWEGTIGGYFGIGGHISGRRDRFGRIYVGLNVGWG